MVLWSFFWSFGLLFIQSSRFGLRDQLGLKIRHKTIGLKFEENAKKNIDLRKFCDEKLWWENGCSIFWWLQMALKFYEVIQYSALQDRACMSLKVRTLFEELVNCIKLLPLFPTRLEFGLIKMKREFGFSVQFSSIIYLYSNFCTQCRRFEQAQV